MVDPDEAASAWLAERDIADVAEACGLYVVDDAKADIHPSFRAAPAVALPYFNIDRTPMTFGNGEPFVRVRYLADAPIVGGFTKKKTLRYSQPAKSGVRAYLSLLVDWNEVFADPEAAILITEGEAKAIAACKAGFNCIGLGGVSNFMADGKLLPELDGLKWRGNNVYVIFDSDARDNPDIRAAEERLFAELSTRRGANVYIVRLPGKSNGVDLDGNALPESKLGLDDFLLLNGPDAVEALCVAAPSLSGIDRAVLLLNQQVAWIRSEGSIFDRTTKQFISKDNFTNGEKYSAIRIVKPVLDAKSAQPKTKVIQVAKEWLSHENTARYDDILFRPDDNAETIVTDKGLLALNMWSGLNAEPGDVQPFLDLHDHIHSELPEDLRDWTIKLMAYKAQNLTEKVDKAPLFVGRSGSGKSLWCNCVCAAFSPYSDRIDAQQLAGDFNGWVERTLVVFIDEAKAIKQNNSQERLKALITEKNTPMNEKFRPSRNVDSFTLYMLADNNFSTGKFDADDRRMFVVRVPDKNKDQAFYLRVADWKRDGGARHLMHYLLTYDLKGWRPPSAVPETDEKAQAYEEGLSPVAKLAVKMLTADRNVIQEWISAALGWATEGELSNNSTESRAARETRAALSSIQIRPYYTAVELAFMFPNIAVQMQSYRKGGTITAGQISGQLRQEGIRYLKSVDNPTKGFMWRGEWRQYLVIAQPDDFGKSLTQAEFERQMAQWPRFGQLAQPKA